MSDAFFRILLFAHLGISAIISIISLPHFSYYFFGSSPKIYPPLSLYLALATRVLEVSY
jgi:hypothetical protein